MPSKTTAEMLEEVFSEIHALEAEMKALPDLDEFGVPNDLNSPSGREWEALFKRHTALARRAARLVIDAP